MENVLFPNDCHLKIKIKLSTQKSGNKHIQMAAHLKNVSNDEWINWVLRVDYEEMMTQGCKPQHKYKKREGGGVGFYYKHKTCCAPNSFKRSIIVWALNPSLKERLEKVSRRALIHIIMQNILFKRNMCEKKKNTNTTENWLNKIIHIPNKPKTPQVELALKKRMAIIKKNLISAAK